MIKNAFSSLLLEKLDAAISVIAENFKRIFLKQLITGPSTFIFKLTFFNTKTILDFFNVCVGCSSFIKHVMTLLFFTSNFDYRPGITQVLNIDQTMPFLLRKSIIIKEQNIRTDLNTKTSVICGINSTPYMMHYHSGQDRTHCLPRSVHCDFHLVAIISHSKKDIFL